MHDLSVTPPASALKPTARPVLHKNGDDGLANPSETAETFDASRVRRHRLAQITPLSCFLRLPVAPTGAARRLFKGSRRLAGARHFWQVARVRDSESMQRAVWRKNPDTFYVAIEKKAVLWVKSATEKTGNSRFRYSVPKGQSALSDLKWLKMTANGAVYCT